MTDRYTKVHEHTYGPGDARPTVTQVIADAKMRSAMKDKVILITGASSGIGIITAEALYTTGATLYLTARDVSKGRSALSKELVDSPRVHLLEMDQNSLASVRACAQQFLSMSSRLNILIGNAGVMATPEGKTADGFETQFGVNHLSHFLLFNLLRPALLEGAMEANTALNSCADPANAPDPASRVILLTSNVHRAGSVHLENLALKGIYDPWLSYAQSKTANLWTTNYIDRHYAEEGIRAFGVHPGLILTPLTKYMDPAYFKSYSTNPENEKVFKSPEQGAATTVWAAVSKDLKGIGGKYLENVGIGGPEVPGSNFTIEPGYAPWAFEPENEDKLWKISLEMVGGKQ
jgi:NAD(P)-dependent dehydrogenase (short-subunit alcohol dehydrogenase family)